MKIGIITIQKSEVNYGACLQSYALWKYISDLGYNCEVIDLLRPCHSGYRISKSFGEKKRPVRYQIRALVDIMRKRYGRNRGYLSNMYSLFNSKIVYSKEFNSVESLYYADLQYDVLVSGSDQIWNPKMPFINDPYFLTFATGKVKRIAYASSFGIDSLPEEVTEHYELWLRAYDHLSTREESGAMIIEKLIGKKIPVVLDPVFLLSNSQWRKEMLPCKRLEHSKFVLVYMLNYDEKVISHAASVAKYRKLPLYFILSEHKVVQCDKACQLVNIGPAEWIWLIDNADVMITTSFHGSAFSLIFRTPLVVFLKKGNPTNTRIEGLFKSLKLESYVHDVNSGICPADIPYSYEDTLEKNLITLRDNSMNYLRNAIER